MDRPGRRRGGLRAAEAGPIDVHFGRLPLAASAALLLGTACQSGDAARSAPAGAPGATAPASPPAHGAVVAGEAAAVAPEAPALVRAALAGAGARVLPELDDDATRARLRAHLRDLAAALEAGDGAKARRDLRVARRALARYATRSPDAARTVVPIAHALDRVERLLDSPPPPAAAHRVRSDDGGT